MSMNANVSSESEEPIQSYQVPQIPKSKKQLRVIRSAEEAFQSQTYYITSEGVNFSLRQPGDGYFKIGRQQITESGQRPNDLMLPPSDRAISRSHCKIDYKSFFDANPPETWIAFLMASHPRLGKKSLLQNLPIDLYRYVLSFLKQTRYPLLIDLGSMCGTYIKVSNTEPVVLEQGLNFLVGSDINIEIDKVLNDPIPTSLNSEATIEDFGNTMQDLSPCSLSVPEGPFIIIKISRYFSDNETTMQNSTWRFLAEEKFKVFTIGRSQACDIHLSENTISRTQCRVIYNEGNWILLDGIENKPTVNGTWLSIRKKNLLSREISKPFPIKKSTQIKISDTIIQVDWD